MLSYYMDFQYFKNFKLTPLTCILYTCPCSKSDSARNRFRCSFCLVESREDFLQNK